MNAVQLFDLVEADENLEGLGVDKDGLLIKCLNPQLKTRIGLESLADTEWEDIRAVLVGEREPITLRHMSRVVGYYSMIENWNKSKIGELEDRQRGNYAVS